MQLNNCSVLNHAGTAGIYLGILCIYLAPERKMHMDSFKLQSWEGFSDITPWLSALTYIILEVK